MQWFSVQILRDGRCVSRTAFGLLAVDADAAIARYLAMHYRGTLPSGRVAIAEPLSADVAAQLSSICGLSAK